ncbi:hypothetical protein PSSHI_22290 [Photobacterium sp. R1]
MAALTLPDTSVAAHAALARNADHFFIDVITPKSLMGWLIKQGINRLTLCVNGQAEIYLAVFLA